MSFTEIEKNLQKILVSKNESLDYYPKITRELVENVNNQFKELINMIDDEYSIYQKYINKEISYEEKDTLTKEFLMNSLLLNRGIKETILTIQEKIINFNTLIKSIK